MIPQNSSGKEANTGRVRFTAIELLFFIVNVTIGTMASIWALRKFGWAGAIIGFICGFLFIVTVGYIIVVFYGFIWSGRPWAPPCQAGKCRAKDYRSEEDTDGNWSIQVCRCGDRYRKKGRQFFKIQPDGSEKRYMIWKAFRGWFIDN